MSMLTSISAGPPGYDDSETPMCRSDAEALETRRAPVRAILALQVCGGQGDDQRPVKTVETGAPGRGASASQST
jgi:hypothetical protein